MQSDLSPRIYFHIADESQRAAAEQLAETLRAQGMLVPGIEQRDNSPADRQLRYFRSTEADEAARIASILGVSFILTAVPGYETSPTLRQRHYELWLGRSFAGPS